MWSTPRKSLLVAIYNYWKKDVIDLININGGAIKTWILTIPFLFLNHKQTMGKLNMTIFSSRRNCFINMLIVSFMILQYTKFKLAFKYLTESFEAFLFQPFARKESFFSFKLFKWCIDCFSIHELIVMVGSNFKDRWKKILWGRVVMEWKPHVSFIPVYRNIYSYLNSRRINKCPTPR